MRRLAAIVAAALAGAASWGASDPKGVISEELSAFGVKPKTVAVAPDLALDAALAIKRGDYESAEKTAGEVLARSRVRVRYFYPFNVFMHSIARGGQDPVFLEHLNEWVARSPKSAVAYLVRAEYYETAAWAARSADSSEQVPESQFALFHKYLGLAADDARRSIALNSRIPWSHYLLLRAVSSEGNSSRAESAFRDAIKAYPDYYDLYQQRLYSLTPKWGGSLPAMYEFVDRHAGGAQANSALKLLYLQLYAYVMDAASYSCGSLKGDVFQRCVDRAFANSLNPSLVEHVRQALDLFKSFDPIDFNRSVWPILRYMVESSGSEESAFPAILTMAANSMNTDIRMSRESERNSYVLDDITAKVWSIDGNAANAEKKFQQALIDVEQTSFSDEAQKDEALAEILDDMVTFADRYAQFADIITYFDAARAVGGPNHTDTPWMKCYALDGLKRFHEAVEECSNVIEGNGDYMQTHYWRAKAYERLHEWDASLADFGPIADGANNWFRVGAALDMSYDLGQKHDYAAELASLNRHAYLFDERLQPKDTLAASYNNRCNAHMRLDQLQEALEDCTTSLKFGHVPEADYKLQELKKKLGIQSSP
jgi:tetratricopeptide (TPR) repeat protein